MEFEVKQKLESLDKRIHETDREIERCEESSDALREVITQYTIKQKDEIKPLVKNENQQDKKVRNKKSTKTRIQRNPKKWCT